MRQEPFERVVEQHGPMVLRVCRAVLGPVAADDAWSETFLSAMSAYPTLRPDSNLEAWLVTIAHRKALDQVRVAARQPVLTPELPDLPVSDPDPISDEPDLWAALKALPLKQRQTVAYHYLAGLPYAEIATLLGGTPEAARRAASDGIAALRRTLPGARTPTHPPPPSRAPARAERNPVGDEPAKGRPQNTGALNGGTA